MRRGRDRKQHRRGPAEERRDGRREGRAERAETSAQIRLAVGARDQERIAVHRERPANEDREQQQRDCRYFASDFVRPGGFLAVYPGLITFRA